MGLGFIKAMEDLNKLYEAREDVSTDWDHGDGTFQLSFDDLDDNLNIKPEVEAAMKKRVELQTNYKNRELLTLEERKRYWEIEAELSKLKRKYKKMTSSNEVGNHSAEEVEKLGKELLDKTSEFLALDAKHKMKDLENNHISNVLPADEFNNPYIKRNSTYVPEPPKKDQSELEKEEDGRKIAGQTWIDFDSDKPYVAQRVETPKSIRNRKEELKEIKDAFEHGMITKDHYDSWVAEITDPFWWQSKYEDKPVEDKPADKWRGCKSVADVLKALKAGDIDEETAEKLIKKFSSKN